MDYLPVDTDGFIDVAGDGSKAVFSVRSIVAQPPARTGDTDVEPAYAYRAHLFLLDLKGLEVDGRDLAYTGEAAKALKPLLRKASLRPDHKILRVRVPVTVRR